MVYFVEKATEASCNEIVNIHIEAFDGFFLTILGKCFLQTYYKAVINSLNSIAYCVMDENGHLVGFSVGAKCSRGFHRKILKENFGAFLWQGIIILFTKPKAIYRLMRNMEKNSNVEDDGRYAELLSIGVLPSYAGKGIGSLLIQAFEKEAKMNKIDRVSLTTDYENNESAIAFYKKQGYTIFYDFYTYPKRRMFRLLKQIIKQ